MPQGRLHQVGQEVHCVGTSQPGDRVPSGRGRVAWDGGRLIVTGRDIKEVIGVLRWVSGDRVQGGIDIAQIASSHLVGYRDQTCPLGRAAAGAAYDIPTDAARIGATATRA